MYFKRFFTLLLVVIVITIFFQNSFAQNKRKPVTLANKRTLYLRVLARPFSNIYKKPSEKSSIVQENVPVFQTYFVYTCPEINVYDTKAEGWYEVGSDDRGTVLGWMKAEDVMQWKQTMCLAYKHPGGRKPVLMFEDYDKLKYLIELPSQERINKANNYYKNIESFLSEQKKLPHDFPIISIEPEDAIEITKQFYLLPILEYVPFDIEGREGRLLKIASAPKTGRGKETLKTYVKPFQKTSDAGILKNIKLDIVYVVDMTGSMGAYIKAVLSTIKKISTSITKNSELARSIRFGLWGYRDSLDIPDIGFHTKNFTPQLQKVNDFSKTLASVNVSPVTPDDYPEDVFSGVDNAMRKTQWTEKALHIIILIGDASSHGTGHKWNYSGQSARTLRIFASDHKFSIFSLFIKDQTGRKYWSLAKAQFRTLSKNRGVEDYPSYSEVDSHDHKAFEKASDSIAKELISFIEDAKKGRLTVSSIQKDDNTHPAQENIEIKVRKLGYAALVDWIGREKETKAPRDIIAWVVDKDLIDTDIQSLDVRVLINKRQLDSLKTVLQEIMTASKRGEIGDEKLFDALQAVPSAAARAGEQIAHARTLADTGLIPEFMHDLPYHSHIMDISNELWETMSIDQKANELNQIEANIRLYVAIHDEPGGWIPLNKEDDPDQYVYPISLDSLP